MSSSLSSRAAGAVQTNGFRLVDLSPFARSAEILAGGRFSGVPKGLQSFRGVPFLIQSRFVVAGMDAARAGELLPDQVSGIRIGGNARR